MDSWLQEHQHSHVALLAFEPARAVGMIWLAVIDRLPSPGRPARRGGQIQSFFVHDWARNQGVGTHLLANAVGAARQLGMEWVVLHPSARSRPLYQRAGFAESPGLLELRLDGGG
jgi:GNAT superfamily N-acetyltransferase